MKWWVVPAGAVGVLVLGVAAYGAVMLAQGDSRWPLPFKQLRQASESMAPTIRSGMRVTARSKPASELKRGDIVVFAVGENLWVQRLIGLPGDRVEMRAGLVVLNGQPIAQADAGSMEIEGAAMSIRSEQLPGEATAHRVLDQGAMAGDHMPEVQVPPGKLFLLGDNRDNSMDSRFPAEAEGMGGGMIALTDVYGTISPADIGD